jgi:hypothetical protein
MKRERKSKMKVIKTIIRILILLITILPVLVCASDLIDVYFLYKDYYIGSESMIGVGGWKYRTNFNYVFSGLIVIIISLLLSFWAIRIKKIKFLLLILLLAICQILCMILL